MEKKIKSYTPKIFSPKALSSLDGISLGGGSVVSRSGRDEYGRCEVDEVDEAIDILYWMPLPSPPVNEKFTK